jgi:hypothetical protein
LKIRVNIKKKDDKRKMLCFKIKIALIVVQSKIWLKMTKARPSLLAPSLPDNFAT